MSDVEIQEKYDNYKPPFDVQRVVHRLLSSIPDRYTIGLKAVVLLNVDALPRRRRRKASKSRGRNVRPKSAAGYYNEEWKGEPAHVELLVDNMCRSWMKGGWWRLRVIQDMIVARVLFHEIGHHVHAVLEPEHREREDVADEWGEAFSRLYFRRNYWYLMPVALLFRFVAFIRRSVKRG